MGGLIRLGACSPRRTASAALGRTRAGESGRLRKLRSRQQVEQNRALWRREPGEQDRQAQIDAFALANNWLRGEKN